MIKRFTALAVSCAMLTSAVLMPAFANEAAGTTDLQQVLAIQSTNDSFTVTAPVVKQAEADTSLAEFKPISQADRINVAIFGAENEVATTNATVDTLSFSMKAQNTSFEVKANEYDTEASSGNIQLRPNYDGKVGYAVKYNPDAIAVYNIDVPKAGDYRLTMRHLGGAGLTAGSYSVSVDGTKVHDFTNVSCGGGDSADAYKEDAIGKKLNLTAGSHTITLEFETVLYLSKMTFLQEAKETVDILGNSYDTEQSLGTIEPRTNYDGAVGYAIKCNPDAKAVYTVNVATAGEYDLTMRHLGGASEKAGAYSVTVDGETIHQFTSIVCGNGSKAELYAEDVVPVPLQLSAGTHTIALEFSTVLYFSKMSLSKELMETIEVPVGEIVSGVETLDVTVNAATQGAYQFQFTANALDTNGFLTVSNANNSSKTFTFASANEVTTFDYGAFTLQEGENTITFSLVPDASLALAKNLKYLFPVNHLKAGTDLSFTFKAPADLAYGVYPVVIMRTDIYGTVQKASFDFFYLNPSDVEACVNGFKAATEDNFTTVYNTYVTENKVYNASLIPELSQAETVQKLGKYYIFMRDYYTQQEYLNYDFNNLEDVDACIKGALVLKALDDMDQTAFESLNAKYGVNVSKLFDTNVEKDVFFTIYKELKPETLTSKTFYNAIRHSIILSHLKNNSNNEASKLLETNSVFLGIDTAYLKNNKVSYLEIANKLDKEDVVQYGETLGKTVNDIAKDIVKEKENDKNSGSTSGGGGGGGGGGGSSSGGNKYDSGTRYPTTTTPVDDKTDASTTVTPEMASPYVDTAHCQWAVPAITRLTELGVLSVNETKTFRPDDYVTREEFTKMLVVAFSIAETNPDFDFADCTISDWWYPYVKSAYGAGLIKGISDDTFGVGSNMKRQDMATILKRLLTLQKKLPAKFEKSQFADGDEIADYAKDAVDLMTSMGIIQGFEDNTFKPNDSLTRAQAAVVIDRLLGKEA